MIDLTARITRSTGLVGALAFLLFGASQVYGQVGEVVRPEFSLTVELPEIKNDTKNLLSQIDQHLQQKNWQDAIDTLNRLIGSHGDELIARGSDQVDLGSQYTYYVDLKSYLQRRIAEYSRQTPEFLAVYRQRVDPLAKQVLDQAKASRDPAQLAAAIDDYFLCSYTDEALLFLGDLLLEQARFNEARTAWERISPRFRTPDDPSGVLLAMPGQPMWVAVDGIDWSKHRNYIKQRLNENASSSPLVTIPNSNLDPASIWARLCLASWLEGAEDRARSELELLKQLYPDSQGYLGGRTTNYATFLARLIETSHGTLPGLSAKNWPTFAGDYSRNGHAKLVQAPGTYRPNWSVTLDAQVLSQSTGGSTIDDQNDQSSPLIAETEKALNSTFPIVQDRVVIVADEQRVRAFDLESGLAAFPTGGRVFDQTDLEYGAFYSAGRRVDFDFDSRRRGNMLSAMSIKFLHALGVPRFTSSTDGNMLVARVGTTAIGVPMFQAQFQEAADMVIFDMSKQGKIIARIPPVTELSGPWSFEGTAIIRGNRLYCGMTKSGVRDESAVACFDWTTSQMLWRKSLSITQPYGSGLVQEADFGHRSHNLLTLKDGVLYYNTNHGVIAALDAQRGETLWLTHYPRRALIPSTRLDLAHSLVQRNINPCVVTQGLVISMPLDCDRVFALDAATGQLVWQTVPGGIEPLHILGATGEDILVSGNQLFWIQLHSGKIRAEFPKEARSTRDRGFGRGTLVGDQVYWPTRDAVYRLNAHLSKTSQVVEAGSPVDLAQFGEEGGNLVVSGDYLIIASPSRMTVYSPASSDVLPPQAQESDTSSN
ncbi:PQQ-binding-like beta-propeller repeat protein [Blastopirellula marina]|uniref:Pyrrolo-quinoline quinone repeat domain-containing protein n=1 Tax=Blastopirellula marina TaxID=124 RepID=A0A2S8F6H7_9BACT|nr:PQQ-binding-like beta-propeller repeat protein [Blastopirellula marina]PQO27755.1 hypothetical protein C5Y98_27060 [Blastopirellula marina]PTL41495.1 hypothetical protein C5Y97_27075 [Blastopirellula marina]